MALKFPDILEHNNPANPLVDITELRGNTYPIGELSETGSIPSAKRNLGAIVFASSSQEFYGFYGETTSSVDWDNTSNWRTLSTFTGDYEGTFTGSFSGSYVGDGSQLTGIDAAINSYTNPANNRIITSVDSTSVNAEANLTFDGNHLGVTGSLGVSGETTLGDASDDPTTIYGEIVKLVNVPAGTDNTVLVLDAENNIVTDEIDSRVWGSTLIDGSLISGRVPYASDANTIQDSANLKFNGTTLIANAATITTDLLVSGDLTVVGTASFQHTDSLQVADRFVLLASGSNSNGMGGIVVQQDTQDVGEVFSWDDTTSRWATTGSFNAASNTFTPEAFMASVIDIDGGNTDIAKYQKNGNIKVDGGDIYIYS